MVQNKTDRAPPDVSGNIRLSFQQAPKRQKKTPARLARVGTINGASLKIADLAFSGILQNRGN